MAEFRSIHCKTWRDDWFSELPTDAKLLWLYLITNQSTSVSGIYQLPVKFIAFETGLDKSRVAQILDMFKSDGKIDFDDSVIWVKKMREYQSTGSDKVHTRIMADFNSLPDCRVKGIYAQKYGIDTVSIGYFQNAADTDTDTETDTIQKQDTETETDTKRSTAKPHKPADKSALLIKDISADLQEALEKAYQSLGRKTPIYFKNEQQRDAYRAAIIALNKQSKTLIDKGISRERTSLSSLLAWLETCVKNQNGNGQSGRNGNAEPSSPMLRAIARREGKLT